MSEWHTQAVEYIAKAWGKVKPVRRPFYRLLALGIVIASVITWYGTKTFYSERMEALEEQKKVLEERLKQKDDLLAEFREKSQSATPDKVAEKIVKLETEIDRLKKISTPELQIRDERWEKSDDESWFYSVIVHVNAISTPNGLLLRFRAEDIRHLEIVPINDRNFQGDYYNDKDPEFTSFYIQKPFGHYKAILQLARKTEILFKWEFDGVPGGEYVAR